MNSPFKNGKPAGASSLKNYKYRRLSSLERGSDNTYISCDEDEDEIFTANEMELKKIGGKLQDTSTKSPVKFVSEYEQLVSRPIKSGETLRSIALKYRIPLSELKRVNHIIQDNEFFALNTLKIPVKSNSVLSEMLEKENQDCKEEDATNDLGLNPSVGNTRAALLGTTCLSSCSDIESESELHVGYISINRILRDTRTQKQAKRFLNTMNRDLADIRAKTNTYKDSLDDAAAALNDLRFRPLDPGNNENDWGLNWWKILLAALLILVGVPLAYIFFYFKNYDNE